MTLQGNDRAGALDGEGGVDHTWGDDPQFPAYGGDDVLIGGAGSGILRGGLGNDFSFTKEPGTTEVDTLYGEGGTDTAKSPGDGNSDRDPVDLTPLGDIEVLS